MNSNERYPLAHATNSNSTAIKISIFILVGLTLTGIGGFYCFLAGVSMNTAMGVNSGKHATHFFMGIAIILSYWTVGGFFVFRNKKHKDEKGA